MADIAVQLPYLSSHFSVPETTLTSLTQAPTVELVNQLLQSLTKTAHEYDELKSDKRRLEVELEAAVRSNESKVKALKSNVDKEHKEVEELRKKLHESGMNPFPLSPESSMLTYSRNHPRFTGKGNLHIKIFIHIKRIRDYVLEISHLNP